MDDTIRDLLDSAAPERPALPAAARADAVRTRAHAVRRRNGLVLAAAVTAVVGIGVAVPVLTSGSDDDRSGGVASDPTPEVLAPPPCPAEPVVVDGGGSVAVPEGAFAVRACPAVWNGGGQPALSPPDDVLPTEPLVDGAAAFLAEVRGLPAYTLEEECAATMVQIQPWALVASYADGSSAVLAGTTRACAPVPVEGVDRSAAEILSLFTAAAGGS